MKKQICFSVLYLMAMLTYGQGTFIYDQQSATESQVYGLGQDIQSGQPLGQSFTPTLSSVGFIRIFVEDDVVNGAGATIYLDLWSDSIGGTLLGSTAPVSIAYSGEPRNFFFSTSVSVNPGTTYYFQPILESGSDNTKVGFYDDYYYTGGTMIVNGAPNNRGGASWDLWFREGIYMVPEPAPSWLLCLASAIFFCARRKRPEQHTGRFCARQFLLQRPCRRPPDQR